MTQKGKSRPLVAQETGRTERTETAAGMTHNSYCNTTTSTAQRQVPKLCISDFLGVGEENGKTLKELREILNGDGRSIRAQIERERRTTPILSGKSGYFLPACEDEVRRFDASMKRRARAVWASSANVMRAAGLSKCAPRLDGQTDFWGGDGDV